MVERGVGFFAEDVHFGLEAADAMGEGGEFAHLGAHAGVRGCEGSFRGGWEGEVLFFGENIGNVSGEGGGFGGEGLHCGDGDCPAVEVAFAA